MRLQGTNLSGADLRGADMTGARMFLGSLSGALLAGSQWNRAALLGAEGITRSRTCRTNCVLLRLRAAIRQMS